MAFPKSYAVAIEIEFGRKNSFIYQGSNMVIESIKNSTAFAKALHKPKGWKSKWVVVTKVHHAAAMTLFLSETKNGSATMSGNIKLTASNTAALEANAGLSHSSSVIADFMVKAACTPMAQAHKVNRKGLKTMGEDDPDGIMFVMESEVHEIDEDTEFAPVGFDFCEVTLSDEPVLLMADEGPNS